MNNKRRVFFHMDEIEAHRESEDEGSTKSTRNNIKYITKYFKFNVKDSPTLDLRVRKGYR
jgi:hypothetical protein